MMSRVKCGTLWYRFLIFEFFFILEVHVYMQKTLCCEISFSRSARQLVHLFVVVVERVGLFSQLV